MLPGPSCTIFFFLSIIKTWVQILDASHWLKAKLCLILKFHFKPISYYALGPWRSIEDIVCQWLIGGNPNGTIGGHSFFYWSAASLESHASPEKVDVWGWGGPPTFVFPTSKFLGQFSRHRVGVPIVHHQPLWQAKQKEKKSAGELTWKKGPHFNE